MVTHPAVLLRIADSADGGVEAVLAADPGLADDWAMHEETICCWEVAVEARLTEKAEPAK